MSLRICFRTRLEKKIVLSALRMLLRYYEETRLTEGTLTRIANTVGKSHLTVKRYLWELCRRGIIVRHGRVYRFDPENIKEALRRAEGVDPKLDKSSLDELRDRIERLETTVKEISKHVFELERSVKTLEERIARMTELSRHQCRHGKVIRDLDEWSKSMDEWADAVDKRLDDLEERVRTLASMILRVLDKQ